MELNVILSLIGFGSIVWICIKHFLDKSREHENYKKSITKEEFFILKDKIEKLNNFLLRETLEMNNYKKNIEGFLSNPWSKKFLSAINLSEIDYELIWFIWIYLPEEFKFIREYFIHYDNFKLYLRNFLSMSSELNKIYMSSDADNEEKRLKNIIEWMKSLLSEVSEIIEILNKFHIKIEKSFANFINSRKKKLGIN